MIFFLQQYAGIPDITVEQGQGRDSVIDIGITCQGTAGLAVDGAELLPLQTRVSNHTRFEQTDVLHSQTFYVEVLDFVVYLGERTHALTRIPTNLLIS